MPSERLRRGRGELEMMEIRFRGRGGQGAVIASEILGRAFFLEGKYAQSFSLFGGERRGAPVFGFLRVDEEPIFLKCQIKQPDHEIIFDLTLVEERQIAQGLKPRGLILINTERAIDSFCDLREFKMGLVDASSIARAAGLGESFNTAMLGAYARLSGLIGMKTLAEAVRTMVPAKVEANLVALREAYEAVRVHEIKRNG